MKKLRIMVFFVALAGLSFSSCSSDDDGEEAGPIEGRWNPVETIVITNGVSGNPQPYTGNEADCNMDYKEFLANGTFRNVILFKNVSNVCTEDARTGSWNKNLNTLTIDGTSNEINEGDDGVYTVIKLTTSELRYKSTATTGNVTIEVIQVFSRAEE